MRRSPLLFSPLLSATILLFTSGCSDNGPRLAPVTGVITLDGEPLSDAGILFVPTAGGPAASASTEEDGSFRLNTNGRDGALVGSHQVGISKSESVGVGAEEGDVSGAMGGGWRIVHHMPARYSQPESSGLTADVKDEQNEINFPLSTEAEE